MEMLKSLLFVSASGDMWGSFPEDDTIVVKSLKEAKIKLLEKEFENLVIADISPNEQNDLLISFVENLKAHPRLSSLKVYIASDAVGSAEIENKLLSSEAVIVPGAEYFFDENIGIDAGQHESFDEIFSELKNASAKSLALLKIEYAKNDKQVSNKSDILEEFLKIIKKEISGL